MDRWLHSEIRIRRDDAFENARCRRLSRLAASGRSKSIRIRVAAAVEAMSDVLAAVASGLRDGETA